MAAGGRQTASRWQTPTVTLGRLYLAQGHRREAAEIFEQILRADPGNRRAREGLQNLRGKRTSGSSGNAAAKR